MIIALLTYLLVLVTVFGAVALMLRSCSRARGRD
jgi:hypothetical protein